MPLVRHPEVGLSGWVIPGLCSTPRTREGGGICQETGTQRAGLRPQAEVVGLGHIPLSTGDPAQEGVPEKV